LVGPRVVCSNNCHAEEQLKIFALACALASVSTAIAFPQYRLEFLRDIDGVELRPRKVNDRGDLIAERPNFGGFVAFVDGQRHLISPPNQAVFDVVDINEHGVTALTSDNGRMYTWSVQTGLVELPQPSVSPSMYIIHAINDNGTIVGRQYSEDGSFAISDFTITSDRQVIVHNVAFVGLDINNSDRAVGAVVNDAGFYRDLGGTEHLVTGFGRWSHPEFIDNDGTMYGVGFEPSINGGLSVLRWRSPNQVEQLFRGFRQHEMRYSGNGTLAMTLSPVSNGRGVVHLWSEESGLRNTIDLMDTDSRALNLEPFAAWDINSSGVAIASVRAPSQSFGDRAAVLRPVPEPGTVLALTAGLAALLGRRRTT